jgi:arylsulfatase A-like enzyme
MILLGTAAQANSGEIAPVTLDDRLVGWQDVMPTLLGLAGVPVPESVEGRSMLTDPRRETLYGEVGEGVNATRMLHDGRFKLIYYPVGNRVQLFDLDADPGGFTDLSDYEAHADIRQRLQSSLQQEFYGSDEA